MAPENHKPTDIAANLARHNPFKDTHAALEKTYELLLSFISLADVSDDAINDSSTLAAIKFALENSQAASRGDVEPSR